MKVVKANVLVKKTEGQVLKQKAGDFEITIPVQASEYDTIEVIAVGPEVVGVEVGDKAFAYKNSGKTVYVGCEEFTVINISEIIVIL